MLVWSTYKPSIFLIGIDTFLWRKYNHSNYRKPGENKIILASPWTLRETLLEFY